MAAGRFAALHALFTGTAAAVPIAAAAAEAGASPFAALELDEATKAALGTELNAYVTEEKAGAFKAGNDRAIAVMGSDKGKAHPGTALAFLGNEKLSALSAEEIIASLPEAPAKGTEAGAGAGKTAAELEAEAAAAAAAAGGTGTAAGSAAHQQRLAGAPKIALGNKASTDATVEETSAAGGDKVKAVSLWGKAQGITDGGKTGANGTTVRVGAAG